MVDFLLLLHMQLLVCFPSLCHCLSFTCLPFTLYKVLPAREDLNHMKMTAGAATHLDPPLLANHTTCSEMTIAAATMIHATHLGVLIITNQTFRAETMTVTAAIIHVVLLNVLVIAK